MERNFVNDPFDARDGVLRGRQIMELKFYMDQGALCIFPSDTCYGLAGLPFVENVVAEVATILHHEKDPIPLSFGSLAMASEFAAFTQAHYRALEEFTPGPLTLVCEMNRQLEPEFRDYVSKTLHTPGTIGIRISSSPIEMQISNELKSPITTSAIRDSSGKEVSSYDDAHDIVSARIKELDHKVMILGIRIGNVQLKQESTVIGFERQSELVVYREGVVPVKRIIAVIRRWGWKDVEDIP